MYLDAGKDTLPIGHCQYLRAGMLTLGQRIKRARLYRGAMSMPPSELRQADVARALGVSEGLVTQWEQGSKKPGRDLVQPLADFLGCDLRWLLTGAGEMLATRPTEVAPQPPHAEIEELDLRAARKIQARLPQPERPAGGRGKPRGKSA